jgi:mannitol/fructose-specific phosphotransferase system IIA component (Ntr-type)
MKAVLEALEAGRLIELPENDKQKALTLLASLVEAVPSVHPGSKIVEAVLAREGQANTYLGDGWAVPHARTAEEGEMLCAIGWSPAGIAYGGRDGASARMLLLYYVPDNQRAAYLKEISSLARLLHENGAMRDVSQAATLNDVRLRLLDIVTAALGSGQAEARARMIRLEAPTFDPSLVVPAWIVHTSDGGVMVLARDETVVKTLEAQADLGTRLERQPIVSVAGYVIHIRQGATYGLGRSLFDCLVVKQPGVAAAPGAA